MSGLRLTIVPAISGKRALAALLLVALLLPCAGCSDGESRFVHREDFHELASFAQDYLGGQLEDHFGSPTAPVVWEDLPLTLHAAEGRVMTAGTSEAGVRSITVTVSDEHLDIEPGMEVMFLSGPRLVKDQVTGWIEEYDAETGAVTFETALAGSAPTEGDRVVFGPGAMIQRGRMLYAEHCQHCHGVSGDGNGPTAQYLNPLPRDYRLGLFKFTSTAQPARASRTDLAHTIENGIPGTYMPSFKLLREDEMDMIVEYVIFLAIRGELEWRITQFMSADYSQEAVNERTQGDESLADVKQAFEESIGEEGEIAEEWALQFQLISESWAAAQEDTAVIYPREPRVEPTPESIARGRLLYQGDQAKCASCHGESGLGDGPQTLAVQPPDTVTGEVHTEPGLYDSWGNPITPRNLRSNIYRGGRRPLDIYRRIHSSIKGTPMPAFGTSLSDQQIWDIVNYVMQMPYEELQTGAGADPPGTAELRALLPPPVVAPAEGDAPANDGTEADMGEADTDATDAETGETPADAPAEDPATDEAAVIEQEPEVEDSPVTAGDEAAAAEEGQEATEPE